jgi:hypothetical protein
MGRIPDIEIPEYQLTEKAELIDCSECEGDCCMPEKLTEDEKTELRAYSLGREHERNRIIRVIRDTYTKDMLEEHGAFVFTEDIIQLIEGKAPQY